MLWTNALSEKMAHFLYCLVEIYFMNCFLIFRFMLMIKYYFYDSNLTEKT